MRLIRLTLCCVMFSLVGVTVAVGEEVTLDKPVRVSTRTEDGTKLAGRVKVYDDEGFELTQGKDRTRTVRWEQLSAKEIYRVKRKLIGWGKPQAYMRLGREMLLVEDGEEWAREAFDSAVFLDPELKPEVKEALREFTEERKAAEEAEREARAAKGRKSRPAGDAARGGGAVGVDNEDLPNAWPALSEEDLAAEVERLKAFMDESAKRADLALTLHETEYFLFYSDLPAEEAAKWARLLDKMYARLCELFGVGEGVNVWSGKAVISVFSRQEEYARFQAAAYDVEVGASAGMCHCMEDGVVHATFYRPPSDLRFARVLVHETAHGFLHRYRTPVWVPSWANEGLAEVVASELVPEPRRAKRVPALARAWLNSGGGTGAAGLDEFFASEGITREQYPVAETLTAYMIRRSKSGYIAFIDGIKDGLTWEQSLQQQFKTTRTRLIKGYLASLGIRDADDLVGPEIDSDRAGGEGDGPAGGADLPEDLPQE